MTLEELEIVVKANVAEATEKLEGLKAQMKDTTSDGFKQITEESEKMGDAVKENTDKISKLAPQIVGLATKTATGSSTMASFGKTIASVGATVESAVPVLLVISAVILAIFLIIKKLTGALGKIKSIIENVIKVAKRLLQELSKQLANAYNIMVSLANRGINNLVEVSTRLNESLSELKSSVTQFGNALATMVAPAIQALTPLLVNFLSVLTNMANTMAQVTASLFGNTTTYKKAVKVNENYAKSVNGVNKAIKGTLASFDELNVISEQSSGGGVSPESMFEDVPIDEKIQELTKEFSELWNTDNIEGLRDFGSRIGAKVREQIEKLPTREWGEGIGTKINNALALANGFLQEHPFTLIGEKIADFLLGMVDTIDPAELGLAIANVIMEAVGIVKSFVERMASENGWKKLGSWLAETLNNLFANIKPEELAETISGLVTGILDLLIEFFQKADWKLYAKQIFETLKNIEWGDIIEKLVMFIWEVWKAKQTFRFMILGYISLELEKWVFGKIVELGKKIIEWLDPYIEIVKQEVKTIKDTFTEVFDSCKLTMEGIIQFIDGIFHGDWEKAWDGIKKAFQGTWDGIESIGRGTINNIIILINAMIKSVVKNVNEFIGMINKTISLINEMTGQSLKPIRIIDDSKYQIPLLTKGNNTPSQSTQYRNGVSDWINSSNSIPVSETQDWLSTSTQANVPVINAVEEMGDKVANALGSLGVYAEFDYSKLKVGLDNENYRAGGKLYGI